MLITELKGPSPGYFEIETVSGNIDIAFAPTNSEFESVSGKISIKDAAGGIKVENVSGDIDLVAPNLAGAEVSTVSGHARVETDSVGDDFELQSVSGSATLIVPRDVAADFDLSTFSGKIRNEIGPQAERTSKYAPGKEVKFSSGGGGPHISMSSFSGTVELLVK